MIVVGLTGSIGMGKSTVAGLFRDAGDAVYDADAAVHRLYSGRAAPLVEACFPGTVRDGVVDRGALGARVLGDRAAMKDLEAIVHPLVREEEQCFLADARMQGVPIAVLDIPLLLEAEQERRADAIVVVSAPAEVQRERVLRRPGMTPERFDAIVGKQMPDEQKRRRAHFVIDTSHSFEDGRRRVGAIRRALFAMHRAMAHGDPRSGR